MTVLLEARKKLSASVQRIRAYPDATDLTMYQGTLALAKLRFLPEGSKPITKAQFAEKIIHTASQATSFIAHNQSMNEAQEPVNGIRNSPREKGCGV